MSSLNVTIPVAQVFTLTAADLAEVEHCRGVVNRMGFAVQLCTVRWRGHFLPDTQDLPPPVLETVAQPLGVLPMPIPDSPQPEKTRWEHLARLRAYLGCGQCAEPARHRLLAYRQDHAARVPQTATLQTFACQWLYAVRIVCPGRTTLRELIGSAVGGVRGAIIGALAEFFLCYPHLPTFPAMK